MQHPPSDYAQWTPLALARDIVTATSAGTVWNGAEIVLWRDSAGTAYAWEDRCPHRGMKLSFGFVRGDRIACLYHGWEYDSTAACRYIPAHPELDVPATIRVARYKAAETLGMIWVAPLDVTAPAPVDETDVTALRSLQVDAPLPALTQLLATAGLPGAGGVRDVVVDGPVMRLTQGAVRLVVGLHPVDDATSIAHLGVQGPCAPDTLAALVPATAALRRRAETTISGAAQ
ncbi:Rieske 2Fe-2S domain-containing protein [Roseinatronobacter sp. NSM]|uniref:Rieske 2Fe-2S domain-containing protein n=1 Tax=Roseinatronobacter sp. NSM TaxID=3457785 RepID=UPI0040372EE8